MVTAHDLPLLVGRLDEFAAKVRAGLADADWQLRREIIRALVKQIEVTTEQISVIFRIGSQSLGPGPPPAHLSHCLPRLPAHAAQARRGAPGWPPNPLRWPAALPRLRLNCHHSRRLNNSL